MSLGSKDPNDRVLGPKYYNVNGIWALNPPYLGPWTRRMLPKSRESSRQLVWSEAGVAMDAQHVRKMSM